MYVYSYNCFDEMTKKIVANIFIFPESEQFKDFNLTENQKSWVNDQMPSFQ